MTQALVLRHMYSGSLFTIEDVFRKKGIAYRYAEGFAQDLSKLDPLEPDIMIVLGGAMGVYQQDIYPYLKDEITLIRKRLDADKPLLGICLGAQLMAAAKGCNVYKGAQGSEFGFFPIELTEEGKASPLRHFAPTETHILQMHGDTFDLPEDAALLASSSKYKHQAYRIGQNGFAVQFHPEFNRIGLENTFVEDAGDIDVKGLREAGNKHLSTMVRQMELFLEDIFKVWKIS